MENDLQHTLLLNFVQYVYIKMVIKWGLSVLKLGVLHFNIKVIELFSNIRKQIIR